MPDGLSSRKEKRALLILYVLALYIVFQLCWWGLHLIQLNREILELKSVILGQSQFDLLQSKIWMVVGEGAVFLLLLSLGFWYIKRTVQRELRLARMEKTFLLSVTHELKTPIAAIKLQLETLKSRKLSEEQTSGLVSTALRETRRLQELSENILMATRLDQHPRIMMHEVVNLSLIVEHEAQRFRSAGFPDIKTKVDDQLLVKGDAQMLTVLVTNLLSNALKYAGKELVMMELVKEENSIVLHVADAGPGITEEEKQKIFGKFYRIGNEETRTTKGTGLGLYICLSIARLHHASISIRDNQPTGSIFVVSFPILNL